MKNFQKLILFSLMLLMVVSSCQKENIIVDKVDDKKPTPTETTTNPLVGKMTADTQGESENGIDLGCLTIDFTFQMDVNGTIKDITDEDSFLEAVLPLEEEPTPDFYINFVYPLNVKYTDGTTGVIGNDDELGDAFASCIPDTGWTDPGFPAFLINMENSCYDLVYPVSLTNENDEASTAANEEEFIDLFANNDYLTFVFPISLKDSDGENHVATEDFDLFDLLGDCDDISFPVDTTFNPCDGSIACYEIKFPFSYNTMDGEVTTVNNLDEYLSALYNGEIFDAVYPITLVDEDGEEFTVNNEEELNVAVAECDGFETQDFGLFLLFIHSVDGGTGCYSINYPISVITDEITTEIKNVDELMMEMDNENASSLVYPVSVTMVETNEEVAIDSFEKLDSVTQDCF